MTSSPSPSVVDEVVEAARELLTLIDDYMVVTSLTANDRWSASVGRLRASIFYPPKAGTVEVKPVAWMTADGRIATDDTKRTAMAAPSRAAFNIPLYATPDETIPALKEAFRELSMLEPLGFSFDCLDRISLILSKAEGR